MNETRELELKSAVESAMTERVISEDDAYGLLKCINASKSLDAVYPDILSLSGNAKAIVYLMMENKIRGATLKDVWNLETLQYQFFEKVKKTFELLIGEREDE